MDPYWCRVAVLHDVGKYHAQLGVFGRVAATVLAAGLGSARMNDWADRSGWRGQVGRYHRHGEIGADEIRAAGGPEDAAVWSEIHHHPDRFDRSSISAPVLAVLDAADH